jgi:helicase SWR1
MDIDPATPIPGPSSSSDLTEPPPSVQHGSASLVNGSSKPRRLLRARPSESSLLTTASPGSKRGRSATSAQLRPATDKELEYIRSKLSEESILANRDGVIKGKEAELRGVVDRHDDAVREKFHLERYISIFEGWNPSVSQVS